MKEPTRSGGKQRPTNETDQPSEQHAATWQPAETVEHRPKRRVWLWLLLVLLPVLVVAGLVVIPPLLPKDPRAKVIENYLSAVRDNNQEMMAKYGVMDEPPMARWITGLRAEAEEPRVAATGDFGPLHDLHKYVESTYRREGDVYLLKDQSPMLANLINQYADARKKGEAIADKMLGTPDDMFDAAEELATAQLNVFDTLFGFNPNAAGGEAPKPLVLTYKQVLDRWGQKLTADQQLLAESFRDDLDKWRRLVGRDPREIASDKPFTVLEHTWVGNIYLPNQSSGEPPVTVRFTLRRFQMDLLDTGWKVWDAEVVNRPQT